MCVNAILNFIFTRMDGSTFFLTLGASGLCMYLFPWAWQRLEHKATLRPSLFSSSSSSFSRNWEKRAGLGRRRPPAGSPPGKLCCVYECVSIHIYDVLRQKRGTGLAHWPTTRSRRWQSSVDRHRGDNVHVRAPYFYLKYCHIFLDFCVGRVIWTHPWKTSIVAAVECFVLFKIHPEPKRKDLLWWPPR